jgi:hypothetical protein
MIHFQAFSPYFLVLQGLSCSENTNLKKLLQETKEFITMSS